MTGMEIVFLGTNGWFDTATGNTVSVLARGDGWALILDAGNGFAKIDDYLTAPLERGFLFLSHFHLDHLAGLHTLPKLKAFRRLSIYGPEGTKGVLETLLAKPFTAHHASHPFRVDFHELPDDPPEAPFSVEWAPLSHGEHLCLGYRITAGGKTLAYCTDTGPCPNAVKLARGADLLIAECSYRSGESFPAWPHLNPEEAAKAAVEAGAKRLALFHFDASRYRTPDDRRLAGQKAREIFPGTIVAEDGLRIML